MFKRGMLAMGRDCIVGEGNNYCGYERPELQEWVLKAPGGTKNWSASGLDDIGYQLLKAVIHTHLGKEFVEEVVNALFWGQISTKWREMRVIFISKPRRDLTKTRTTTH